MYCWEVTVKEAGNMFFFFILCLWKAESMWK